MKGDLKLVYETGYGIVINIYLTATGWKAGCMVTSTVKASSSRRAATEITFSAQVSATEAKVAQTASSSVTKAGFVSAVTSADTTLRANGNITTQVKLVTVADISNIATPKTVDVTAAPTPAPSSASSSKGGGSVVIIIVVVVVIVLLCACGVGGYFYFRGGGEETVAVKGDHIGVEMSGVLEVKDATAGAPPPGAVYMKNGVWMDKDNKPVPVTQE